MYGVYGGELSADGFHSAALKETKYVSDCIDSGKSMRQCARELFDTTQQVVKGMYAAVAPDWLSTYPSDQLRFIVMEEYKQEPTKHIQVPKHHDLTCKRCEACMFLA